MCQFVVVFGFLITKQTFGVKAFMNFRRKEIWINRRRVKMQKCLLTPYVLSDLIWLNDFDSCICHFLNRRLNRRRWNSSRCVDDDKNVKAEIDCVHRGVKDAVIQSQPLKTIYFFKFQNKHNIYFYLSNSFCYYLF